MKSKNSHSIDKIVKFNIDDPIHQIQEYNLDAQNNHIYLIGREVNEIIDEPGVEYGMATRFIKNLNILMRNNKDPQPILIHMKTCGGIWQEGMAIYDAIKACPNPITILNYTHARSMSSIIFQAANKRVMMPHSSFMFHEGTLVVDGTFKQVDAWMTQAQLDMTTMLDIYINTLKYKGKFKRWSKKRIKEWLINQMNKKEDVFLSAIQTVKYGFADEVFGYNGNYHWDKLLQYSEKELESKS